MPVYAVTIETAMYLNVCVNINLAVSFIVKAAAEGNDTTVLTNS